MQNHWEIALFSRNYWGPHFWKRKFSKILNGTHCSKIKRKGLLYEAWRSLAWNTKKVLRVSLKKYVKTERIQGFNFFEFLKLKTCQDSTIQAFLKLKKNEIAKFCLQFLKQKIRIYMKMIFSQIAAYCCEELLFSRQQWRHCIHF